MRDGRLSWQSYLIIATRLVSNLKREELSRYIVIAVFRVTVYAVVRFVVHRRLSTHSFYVSVDLVVQLGDFTRARAVVDDEFIAETDEPVGVTTAAPEVLRHQRYSTKSDVWALGVVFWQVLPADERLFYS